MYHPRDSFLTPPPKIKYVRHPLDFFIHQSMYVPQSRGPNIEGRKIRASLNTNFTLAETPPLALPLHISNHSLTLWRGCRRKHLWSHGYGLYPTGASVHLIAGGAVASGLEAARRRVFLDQYPSEVTHQQMLEAAYPAFSEAWGDFTPPDNPRLAKTYPNTFDALGYYLAQHHPAKDQIQPMLRTDGSPAIEYRFAVPLDILHPSGDPFILIGRFDMLGLIDVYGQEIPCVLDDKTASSIGGNWASSWDMWGQFMCYIWALQKQGIDCNHAVVRGLAILKGEHKVATAVIEYPQHMIDRWERGLYQDLRHLTKAYRELDASLEYLPEVTERIEEEQFPYNFANTCTEYGGCAFNTLCISRDPKPFMSNYIVHRYNPLSHQPVEEVPSDG